MNILWVCGARVCGGAERAMLEVARRLAERGHSVEALLRGEGPVATEASRIGLRVHPAPLGGSWNLFALLAVDRALRRLAPDAALVTTSDEWVWACLARRPACTRLVLVRHMAIPLPRRVCALADRRADAIVAVSGAARDALVARGIRPERVRVIHNSPRFTPRDDPPRPEERRRARAALGLTSDGRWAGFFGGLRTAKGILEVLGAVHAARETVPDLRLLVCGRSGSPAESRAAEKRLRELALGDTVHVLGETDRTAEAMTACDVVILATRESLSEAFPLVLLEAMACGVPVVTFATGGVPEVTGADGHAGRLVTPGDTAGLARSLAATLSDTAGATEMARRALERAREHFSPERIGEEWVALLQSLAAVSGSA